MAYNTNNTPMASPCSNYIDGISAADPGVIAEPPHIAPTVTPLVKPYVWALQPSLTEKSLTAYNAPERNKPKISLACVSPMLSLPSNCL